jgi:hypothetical protein
MKNQTPTPAKGGLMTPPNIKQFSESIKGPAQKPEPQQSPPGLRFTGKPTDKK